MKLSELRKNKIISEINLYLDKLSLDLLKSLKNKYFLKIPRWENEKAKYYGKIISLSICPSKDKSEAYKINIYYEKSEGVFYLQTFGLSYFETYLRFFDSEDELKIAKEKFKKEKI